MDDRRAGRGEGSNDKDNPVYARVANRLATLIDDVHAVWIDRDERRELLTLEVRHRNGTTHPARALSDGTLRFLALAVLELDPEALGLICLEEPENGIHPERIPAMLELLQELATDPREPIGEDNPLRQVIVNTHSPAVVAQVPDDCLLVAELKETTYKGELFPRISFGFLDETWRAQATEKSSVVSKGKLLAYLNPLGPHHHSLPGNGYKNGRKTTPLRRRRVRDRPDLQPLLPFIDNDEA
jgi:hypothetical protein